MLAKANRLTKHGSFNYVYRKGERATIGCISLSCLKGRVGLRIGIVVSNKIGNAVCRNLVKRRIRFIVREHLPRLSSGQVIISTHSGVEKLSFDQLQSCIVKLLTKSKLLK